MFLNRCCCCVVVVFVVVIIVIVAVVTVVSCVCLNACFKSDHQTFAIDSRSDLS